MSGFISDKNLFICYIPGLDLRRINRNVTPHLAGLFESYPWIKLRGFPNTDMVPTLITGVYPQEHGIWQVRLKSKSEMPPHGWDMHLPDILITTWQCLAHFMNNSFDLATIPDRRLRNFAIKRFKLTRQYFPSLYETVGRYTDTKINVNRTRRVLHEEMYVLNGLRTLFGIVGEERSRYTFNRDLKEMDDLMNWVGSGKYGIEVLELHSPDIFQHWNLSDRFQTDGLYRRVDAFIRELSEKCRQKNLNLLLLSDHGQEEVQGAVDINRELKRLDLGQNEYQFYLEAPMARFWFKTDRARRLISARLSEFKEGTVLSYKDMHQYNVRFEDDAYGEIYFITDPGYIIFPSDFHQPLANLFLGLVDWQQRGRIWNPRLRGVHGHLPHHESEKGFMMVLNDQFEIPSKDSEGNVIDVAPSVLGLLNVPKPDYMKGRSLFHRSQSRAHAN
jgi:hypothetical protein